MTITSEPPRGADPTEHRAPRPRRPGAARPVAPARPAPAPFRATLRYRPAFDGIRGAGVFIVMAGHNGFLWAEGSFFWVSTFFTLSAFLITSLLAIERDRTGRIDLRAFWSRRFRRLMPGAVITLLVIALFGATVANPTQLQRLRVDGLSALFYVANWNFVLGNQTYAEFFAGLANPSPVQHFWTLSIEEQFYIVLPLLLVGLVAATRASWRRVGIAVAAITAASVLWGRTLLHRAATPEDVIDRLYFGTDTRLAELTMGVLLAILVSRWRPGTHRWLRPVLAVTGPMALTLILVNTVQVSRTEPWLYEGGLAGHAVLSCIVIAAAAQPHNLAASVLAFRPLAWLGRLSYGVYLLHWPVFLWLDQRRLGLDGWPLFALRLAVTLPLAWASNHFIEHPIRVGRRLQGWRPFVVAPVAVMAVIVAMLAVTVDPPALGVDLTGELSAAPPTAPGLVIDDVVAAGGPGGSVPGTAPGGSMRGGSIPGAPRGGPGTVTTIRRGPAPLAITGPIRILVVGDSQAYVIGNAYEKKFAPASGGQVVAWNQAVRGCGIVRGGVSDVLGKIKPDSGCADWPVLWGKAIDTFKPHIVIVLTGGWDWNKRKLPEWPDFKEFGDPVFDQHIIDEYGVAADLLSSKGATVVWLTQPCYQLEGFGQDPRHLNDPIIATMARTRTEHVATLDLFSEICPGGRFTQELGGMTNVRPDGSHLSDEAALWLVRTWLHPNVVRIAKG